MLARIVRLINRLCLYTTLITLFFYLFALITGFTTASMPICRYASILLYAALLCVAGLLFSTRLPRLCCHLLHYSLSLLGFLLVFLLLSGIGLGNGARTFVLIVLFTLLYFILLPVRFWLNSLLERSGASTPTRR